MALSIMKDLKDISHIVAETLVSQLCRVPPPLPVGSTPEPYHSSELQARQNYENNLVHVYNKVGNNSIN